MALRNSRSSFGSDAHTLHWGTAILIVASLALIETKGMAPRGSALRAGMRAWHSQIGVPGVPLRRLIAPDRALAHRLEEVHEWLGNAMMILIGIHVAGALWHRFVLRDNALARMA